MAKSAEGTFVKEYGYKPEEEFFAPGRANLIGEYTDIAGGHVLPFAIPLGISASLAHTKDRTVRVFSLGEQQEFSLDNLVKGDSHWLNYIIGVFYTFQKHGFSLAHGLDVALMTDLPTASGLSSSAALEVLFGTIIRDELKGEKEISDWDVVKFAKETENSFIGLNSGIMDQFAVEFGREGMAMMLDTKTLEFEYTPLKLGNNDLVIMNSNKTRGLTESKYNDRVKEMNEGLADLRPYINFTDCCSISQEDFHKYESKIKNPLAAKRIKHLLGDDRRVKESAVLLKEGKIDEFAKILTQGHISMRDDFESSGKELDTLVELALKNGAKGARMTGAGFAGCALFISDKRDTKRIENEIAKGYKKECGRKAEFYLAEAAAGARRIS